MLTDLRKVNTAIEQKPFPLPRIEETIQRLEKFKSATALDLLQGYYSIPIYKKSQKICTTILLLMGWRDSLMMMILRGHHRHLSNQRRLEILEC